MTSLIKLVNGDEIIGEIEEYTGNVYTIKEPMLIHLTTDVSGVQGMILIDYAPFSTSDNIKIGETKIITYYDVSSELNAYYLKSILYNKKFHDPKLVNNIKLASNYLDNLLDKKDKPKKHSQETNKTNLESFNIPYSNTVN